MKIVVRRRSRRGHRHCGPPAGPVLRAGPAEVKVAGEAAEAVGAVAGNGLAAVDGWAGWGGLALKL